MILYFDNIITDVPLFPGGYAELDKIRETNSNYRFQDRLKVTMYTLASYAEIKWSEVIIKYEIDDEFKDKRNYFEKFVKKLWPKAHIIYVRSDNIQKFRETAKLINRFKDDWVFYAGNNDHPFIGTNEEILNTGLKKAKELTKKHRYVSVVYSHYPEVIHMPRTGTPIHDIGFPNSKILHETDKYVISYFPKGFTTSMQIVNKNLFNYWVYEVNVPENVAFKRLEDVYKYTPKKERIPQIIIFLKEQVCAHFDGYSHNKGRGYFIPSRLLPPLFLPPGFFENKIKIAYGYDKPRKDWVNINPVKNKYSFEDTKNGTDLKISFKDIPLFWKGRIQKIDINPKANIKELETTAEKIKAKINNPYFIRKWWNFPFYEAYVYQFRMRNLIKRVISTIKPIDNFIKSVERKYQIKL